MSQHARIEEVYDSSEESDPMDMDPSDFEPVSNKFPLQPATSRRNDQSSLINPSSIPSSSLQQQPPPTQNPNQFASTGDLEKFRHYQCIYPVYFDKTRSRAEGRRVGKKLAVENPLARGMVDAVQELGLNALFEPGKVHPKDWSNPGRVKVLVKQNGRAVNPRVKNKHHLYTLVSAHLRAHPTTETSALRLRVPQMPPPDPNKPFPAPAIPRGWKMGTILPLHSPALSGGGVSENFFKEMMAEMQGGGGGGQQEGGSDGGGEGKKKKKDKKDKKKVRA